MEPTILQSVGMALTHCLPPKKGGILRYFTRRTHLSRLPGGRLVKTEPGFGIRFLSALDSLDFSR